MEKKIRKTEMVLLLYVYIQVVRYQHAKGNENRIGYNNLGTF